MFFFTGSPKVGAITGWRRQTSRGLTPVSLELEGERVPCIVDETADLRAAARTDRLGEVCPCRADLRGAGLCAGAAQRPEKARSSI